MEEYLPKEIIYRPKTGFGMPLRSWLNVELKEFVNDFLSKETLTSRGLFKYEEVQKLLINDQKGLIDASYTIFSLICIEMWFKVFVDDHKGN